jgi:hypothetical protein
MKLHVRFHIPTYYVYLFDRYPRRKGTTAVAVRKGIPHTHVDPLLRVPAETKGVSAPIANSEILLAVVRFEVFTAVTMKNGVFWAVTPCGSCKNRRFGGTWRLLHQGDKNR